MEIGYGKLAIAVNRIRTGKLPDKLAEIREFTKADYIIALPDDAVTAEFAETGRSLLTLPEDNPVYAKVSEFMKEI